MPTLPTGTVTFLFTDIEGSTRLLQQLGNDYPDVLEEQRRLLRAAIEEAGGHEFETQGDGLFAAFPSARDALTAAVVAQRALHNYPWPAGASVRARMGLHTGHPTVTRSGYAGIDLHRTARICTAGHGGQVLLSHATRELVEHNVPVGTSLRDLGEHRLKDLQRPEHIYQAVIAILPSEFPRLRSLNAHRHNLPLQMTSFVGREHEVTEVKEALAKARLVTLTGEGGCGKTRLAIQVAADMVDAYPDGAWLVELGTLSDPVLVPQTVAFTVGVREEPSRSLTETLLDYLLPKQLLIVLDNCEHLLAACAELTDRLLRACRHLRVLVTSREELGIAGELTYRVPSLSVPDLRDLPPLKILAQYEAVRLFIERATFALPTFTMTPGNAHAVARICYRLDGIPLALELAAARVKVLSAKQIEDRLDDRFRLLTGGGRTTFPRHQTLRATMEWSHDLLSATERIMLRRLSVFAGGFTLEAAEEVCPGEAGELEVLDLLTRLVHRSLVIAEEHEQMMHYRLLETIRQYAWEKLREAGEETEVRGRHRDVYVGMAEQAEPELRGPEQAVWLRQLEVEHDNLRAALEWSLEGGAAESALRLTGALSKFWDIHGYYGEGRGWLERVLRESRGASPAFRAKALAGAGHLAKDQADYAAAHSLLGESLAIWRQLGDKQGIADSLNGLGAVVWRQGDLGRAEAFYKESLILFEELGANDSIGLLLNNLGVLASQQGDYAAARSLLEESLAILRQLGDKRGIAFAAGNLGVMAFRQGRYAVARALVEESLAIDRELGDKRGSTSELETLGLLAAAQGQAERAAWILGAAEALREAIGVPLSPSERAVYDYDRFVNAIRAALGREALAMAWAEGRAMTLEQAIEYAMREDA